MVDLLKIQFFDKFDWFDSGYFLVQIRMDFFVKSLFVLDIKVRFELFQDFDGLPVFILKVTEKGAFFLIFLFVFEGCRFEINKESCKFSLALVEPDAKFFFELLFFLFLLGLVKHSTWERKFEKVNYNNLALLD